MYNIDTDNNVSFPHRTCLSTITMLCMLLWVIYRIYWSFGLDQMRSRNCVTLYPVSSECSEAHIFVLCLPIWWLIWGIGLFAHNLQTKKNCSQENQRSIVGHIGSVAHRTNVWGTEDISLGATWQRVKVTKNRQILTLSIFFYTFSCSKPGWRHLGWPECL